MNKDHDIATLVIPTRNMTYNISRLTYNMTCNISRNSHHFPALSSTISHPYAYRLSGCFRLVLLHRHLF